MGKFLLFLLLVFVAILSELGAENKQNTSLTLEGFEKWDEGYNKRQESRRKTEVAKPATIRIVPRTDGGRNKSVSSKSSVASSRSKSESEVYDQLMKNYNKNWRPRGMNETIPGTGGPVIITTNVYLRYIKVDSAENKMNVQITLRQEWNDPRLDWTKLQEQTSMGYIKTNRVDIWTPDIFFQNALSKSSMGATNVLIRIYPDGAILYSTRLNLELSCTMVMRNFPFDSHSCLLVFASYGSTTDDLIYRWKSINPIQMKSTVEIPGYVLSSVSTKYRNSLTNIGSYSAVAVEFLLKRSATGFVVRFYVPCILLFAVAWIQFWVDPYFASARATLCIGPLIVLSILSVAMYANLPVTGYVTAMDLWTFVHFALICAIILQYATSHCIARKQKNKKKEFQKLLASDPESDQLPPYYARVWERDERTANYAKRVDFFTAIIFAIIYIVFHIYFWFLHLPLFLHK